jgi:malonate transporter MadM subunit
MRIQDVIESVVSDHSFVAALAVVGVVVWVSQAVARRFTGGRIHGSAIAIAVGLCLASAGGWATGGRKGLADVECLAGIGLLGGGMLRDLAIVATAYGVRMQELRDAGTAGVLSLLVGVLVAFVVGSATAYAFGYSDAVSMTTIGGGAATFIVGPVTGAALGAESDVIALSIATGVVKAIVVMIATPLLAPWMGLTTPRAALIYGGLLGTTSGVAAGLAATDERLVPYGAMTATFYTGLGCLIGPSVAFVVMRALFG